MKRMEDIIKDRLEAYEETLPETGLADFLTRLDESRTSAAPSPARKSRYSIWNIATPAVAASLLAVFVLTRPQGTEGYLANQETMAVNESVAIIEESEPIELLAQADLTGPSPEGGRQTAAATVKKEQAAVNEASDSDSIVDSIAEETEPELAPFIDSDSASLEADNSQINSSTSIDGPSIFKQDDIKSAGDYSDNQIYIKVVTGAASAVSTVSLVTVMSSVGGFFARDYSGDIGSLDPPSDDPPYSGTPGQQYPDFIPSYPDIFSPGNPWPRLVKDYLPLTIGASLRWQFADRLSLTTGMDYNRYKSVYETKGWSFDLTRASVGIPVRVDYSFVRSRLIDLYLGVGGSAEYFVSTNVGGRKSDEDGLLISAQAASGLQVNISKHIGAYVEPRLIWVLPSVLYDDDPFRRDHPLFLKLASGIRYTF